ncbi:MAG: site-2 protease family protein, partial [Candidatus Omnitrophota bacterium]
MRGGSFALFSACQTEIRINFSFFLLPISLFVYYGRLYGPQVGTRAAVLVTLIFACVLIHELTHCWVASRFGIRTRSITLYLFGGVASLDSISRRPWEEFWISLAGPAANFLLAGVLFLTLRSMLGDAQLWRPSVDAWPNLLTNLLWGNLALGTFNLIPAFPMDGGRIARSLLTGWIGFGKATQISVFLGRVFAILMAVFGVWKGNWLLVLVAVFVF